MNDPRQIRIDELKQEIAQWERVHEHELRGLRDDNSRFVGAVTKSAKIVWLLSMPSYVWAVMWTWAMTAARPLVDQIAFVALTIVLLTGATSGAARASAFLAHFWFRSNVAREQMATFYTSLCAAMFVFCWVVMLCRW